MCGLKPQYLWTSGISTLKEAGAWVFPTMAWLPREWEPSFCHYGNGISRDVAEQEVISRIMFRLDLVVLWHFFSTFTSQVTLFAVLEITFFTLFVLRHLIRAACLLFIVHRIA